jgi:hypothetical protein
MSQDDFEYTEFHLHLTFQLLFDVPTKILKILIVAKLFHKNNFKLI